ncbi:MAG: SIS domain-containing protein [Thermosediminibacteraceae bacterium]|nr:SIS domain-containing protein [Thermosediminibacteraceae bacterium]
MFQRYFDQIKNMLDTILKSELESLEQASSAIAKSIMDGGIVHIFGCGHSHILCEEMYYRAGSLVPVHPILDTGLMLHEGAAKSSDLERFEGYGLLLAKYQEIRREDTVIVISNSGRNPVPIEMALYAKERGAKVIVITSMDFSRSQPSRHSSGKHLYEFGDIVIDNHGVPGDGVLKLDGVPEPFAPSSTVIGAAILHAVFARAVEIMHEKGFKPPIFISGNMDGADEHNRALIEKYKNRIRF